MPKKSFHFLRDNSQVAKDGNSEYVNESYVKAPGDPEFVHGSSEKNADGAHPTIPTISISLSIIDPEKENKDGKEMEEDEDESRQEWARPIEFLLSCISMSVGLGNIWRFPTTAYENGGGAFLIPYFVVLFFIGRPLYFLELSIGQFSSYTCVKVWRMAPASKGVGYGQMIASWSVVSYYCSLMGMAVFYFIMSFNKVLPWSVCNDDWADENCVDSSSDNYTSTNNSQSSSEQYYYNYVLHLKDDISDGVGAPDWRLTLCLLFSWVVLFFTLAWGVKSSGKVAYFTALFPYVVLVTLLIRGTTLPGAHTGIKYFVRFDSEKLLDPNVWYAAVTQCFFSLSVGFGALINFGSYNKFSHNVYRDAWIISLTDTCTSLLAGFTIFSILGNLAYELDTDIDKVVRGGSGLAFISYPEALSKFTWAPQLFAVLFFLMLFTLGVGSAAGNASCAIGIFTDKFPAVNKSIITFITCVLGFLCGLVYVTPGGQWILDLVDFFGGGFLIYVLVVLEISSVSYIYGFSNIFRDLRFMLGFDVELLTKACWVAITPVALFGIFIYSMAVFDLPTFDGKYYPDIAYACGWILTGAALIVVPISFLHSLYLTPGDTFLERLLGVFRPRKTWGPKRRNDRVQWEKLRAAPPS